MKDDKRRIVADHEGMRVTVTIVAHAKRGFRKDHSEWDDVATLFERAVSEMSSNIITAIASSGRSRFFLSQVRER